jgi:hypothetical protein
MIGRHSYKTIWERTEGTEFDKAIELFRHYCGLGETFAPHTWGSTHKSAVAEILEPYYGDNGYLKKHRLTPVCNIGFLLLQITCSIPEKDIKPRGGIAEIFEAIKEKTGINVYAFYENKNNTLTAAHFSSYCPLRHETCIKMWSLAKYQSFAEFLISENCLPSFLIKNYTDLRCPHPVNQQSMELFIEDKLDDKSFAAACMAEIEGKHDPVSVMLRFDSPFTMGAAKLCDIFGFKIKDMHHQVVHQEVLLAWFESALKHKKYHLALHFLRLAHNWPSVYWGCEIIDLNRVISGLLGAKEPDFDEKGCNGKILNQYLARVITPDSLHGNLDEVTVYDLFLHKEKIDNFSDIESILFQKNSELYFELLFKAIYGGKFKLAEGLIQSKEINYRQANISWREIRYKNRQARIIAELNREDCIRFTMPQFLLTVAEDYSVDLHLDLLAIFNLLKQIIHKDPWCLNQSDSMGNSIFYYFNRMQKKHKKLKLQVIEEEMDEMRTLITKQYLLNMFNIINPFMSAAFSNDANISILPFDVLELIVSDFVGLMVQERKSISVDEFMKKCEAKCDVSLSHDQAVELFEYALKNKGVALAFHVLFTARQIAAPCQEIVTARPFLKLCSLITQPIHAVYILKFLDYMYREQSFGGEPVKADRYYRELIKIKHYISDWECVNNKYIKYFEPNLTKIFLGKKSILFFDKTASIHQLPPPVVEEIAKLTWKLHTR